MNGDEYRQMELVGVKGPKPPRFADYAYLPERVFPTPHLIIEQGGDLLIHREMDAIKGLSNKQNQIAHLLAHIGENTDHDPRVTFLATTGLAKQTVRSMVVYDYMTQRGTRPQIVPCHDEDIALFIKRWFDDRKGRR